MTSRWVIAPLFVLLLTAACGDDDSRNGDDDDNDDDNDDDAAEVITCESGSDCPDNSLCVRGQCIDLSEIFDDDDDDNDDDSASDDDDDNDDNDDSNDDDSSAVCEEFCTVDRDCSCRDYVCNERDLVCEKATADDDDDSSTGDDDDDNDDDSVADDDDATSDDDDDSAPVVCEAADECEEGEACSIFASGFDNAGNLEDVASLCGEASANGAEDGSPCTGPADCNSGNCVGDAPAECEGFFSCTEGCANNDDACFQTCFQNVGAACQTCYLAFTDCLTENNCFDAQGDLDVECQNQFCVDAQALRCLSSANTACRSRCKYDADCEGDGDCRTVEYIGTEATRKFGFCFDGASDICTPTNGAVEICDGKDNDCNDAVDEGDTCSSDASITVTDLPSYPVTRNQCGSTLSIDVPANAISFHLNALPSSQSITWFVCELIDPDGTDITGSTTFAAAQGANGILVPNTPRTPLKAGTYRVRLGAQGASGSLNLKLILKVGSQPTGGLLKFNVFLVGMKNITAATAPTNTKFARLWNRLKNTYTKAGITVSDDIDFYDVTGDDLTRYTFIDTVGRPDTEHRQLLTLSRAASDATRVNLFFVRDITAEDGNIAGIAAGVPGVARLTGTTGSGVIIGTDLGGTGWEVFPEFIGDIAAHEIGHHLGLYHPTESDGSTSEPLDDTKVCGRSNDKNGDNLVSPDECAALDGRNLMFWQAAQSGEYSISGDQGYVMRRNPHVE